MRIIKTGLSIFVISALCLILQAEENKQAIPTAAPSPEKPAVLFCFKPSFEFLKQMQAAGFEVDYLDRWDDFSLQKIEKFNAIVIPDFPNKGKVTVNSGGGPSSGVNLEDTLKIIDQYIAKNGGVFVNLQYIAAPAFYEANSEALAKWGARIPIEEVDVPPTFMAIHPRLHSQYFYTNNISKTPVSEDVKGIWYPITKHASSYFYYMANGSIDVNDKWTVVMRGPQGSVSKPLIHENVPGPQKIEKPFYHDSPVKEPAYFAIRDLSPGRLALFQCWPVFHIESGNSWIHNGAVMDKGLEGKPSDFGKLLVNTIKWLAAPSFQAKTLGGFKTDQLRITPSNQRPDAIKQTERKITDDQVSLAKFADDPKMFRGMIGARTKYSGGKGTVEEYAAKAKELKLDFIIFMEKFDELTEDELTKLTEDCAKNSNDSLLLLPGYWCNTNIANKIFFFGKKPLYAYKQVLSDDGKTFLLQGVNKEGKFMSSDKSLAFIFDHVRGEFNSVGYFGFTEAEKKNGMSVYDLRAYSMAGIVLYDHGKFVEDMTQEYLITNQGTMTGIPVGINLLDSPEEMEKEVKAVHAVNYAVAREMKTLWVDALTWNHQYMGQNVFTTSGPLIKRWPSCFRDMPFGGDDFVPENGLVDNEIWVTAESGLKEIAVYDGTKLFRRFLFNGEKEFRTKLFFTGYVQKNISLIATDMKDGKALSFPLRCWKDASPASVFCGDHVNDGTMRLWRGVGSQKAYSVPQVSNAGSTWDGGPLPILPLINIGPISPSVRAENMPQVKYAYYPYQIPYLDFCNERVSRTKSVAERILADIEDYHATAWSGYAPIKPAPLFNLTTAYTDFYPYPAGVMPDGWCAIAMLGGTQSSIFEGEFEFKQDAVINQIALTGFWRTPMPQEVEVLCVSGNDEKIMKARTETPRRGKDATNYILQKGDWLAAVSRSEGNAILFMNRGVPLDIMVRPDRVEMNVSIPSGKMPVKKGEKCNVELFTLAFPIDISVPDSSALLRVIKYLKLPDGLKITRGGVPSERLGVLELNSKDGAVEFSLTKPSDNMNVSIPVIVKGLNPRWTSMLLQKKGYGGKNYYNNGENVVSELGVSEKACSYIHVFGGVSPETIMVAGHPIIADEAGKELFIQVTCLRRLEAPQTGYQWHVSVNNPTDKEITAKLRKSFDLPGLVFEEQQIKLKPGEYKVLVHPEIKIKE